MPRFFFRAYPGDLEIEGIEAALARMAGQIGMDALSVVTVQDRVREIRPRPAFATRVTEMEAGTNFVPARRCYVNTRIRPTSAPWMKSRNPLEKIAREAEKLGVKLRASVSCCRNAALVAKYPEAACVNVFGAAGSVWLCPSNPDVREYAVALVEDLSTNYPFEATELADIGDGPDFRRLLNAGVAAGEAEQVLWSWCFCSSCRQRAGDANLDADAVAAAVRERLEPMLRLEAPGHGSLTLLLASDERLGAYQAVREAAVTSLVKSIRSRTKNRLVLDFSACSRNAAARPKALGELADGFLFPFPVDDAASERQTFGDLVNGAGGAARVEVSLPCCPPHVKDGPALVAAAHRAGRCGHPAIGFRDYGLAPEPCLSWVRQAVRFGKREAAG